MIHMYPHIDAIDIPTLANDLEVFDTFCQEQENCAIPFTINTQYNYHPDEEWMRKVSEDLIALGLNERDYVYIDC